MWQLVCQELTSETGEINSVYLLSSFCPNLHLRGVWPEEVRLFDVLIVTERRWFFSSSVWQETLDGRDGDRWWPGEEANPSVQWGAQPISNLPFALGGIGLQCLIGKQIHGFIFLFTDRCELMRSILTDQVRCWRLFAGAAVKKQLSEKSLVK